MTLTIKGFNQYGYRFRFEQTGLTQADINRLVTNWSAGLELDERIIIWVDTDRL